MRTIRLHVYALLAALLVLWGPGPTDAQILGLTAFAVDLTKRADVGPKIRWDDTDLFALSDKGLGRKDTPTGGRDVTLRTTQPIALGTWWRPTDNASIQTVITWAGEHAGAMPAALYVSYSCDAASWSDWQLVPESRTDKTKTTRVHNTVLQIPRNVRKDYWRGLREYGKQDGIAWESDEEAFVTWYRERHPKAFTKTRPFLGYLRFQYETAVPHGTYITGLEVDVTWVVSGISSIPSKAEEARHEKRRDGAWSWKADGSHLDPQGFDRATVTRAVYEAALRATLASETGEEPMEGLLLLADTGRLSARIVEVLQEIDGITFKDGATEKDPPAVEIERKLKPEGVAAAHLDAFLRGRRLSGWVPTNLEVGLPITRVWSGWLEAFMKEGKPTGWRAIEKRFGKTRGYTQVSEVVFDAKRTRALVTVGRYVGVMYGAGHTMLLELRDGRWAVISTTIAWMS